MSDLLHCLVRTRGSAYFLPAEEYETVRRKKKHQPKQLYETNDLFGCEVAFLPGNVVALSRAGRPQLEAMSEFFEEVEDVFGDDNPYGEEWKT